jgi:hypothetical protein
MHYFIQIIKGFEVVFINKIKKHEVPRPHALYT